MKKNIKELELGVCINSTVTQYDSNHCAMNSLGLLEKRPLLINLDDGKFSSLIETKHFDIDYYLKAIDKKS